ncbi:CRISPR-associated endonuclease Cas2 [Thermoanaerobacterium thermosaccharolyticum]|jgi:CRISPR-associated protein Cas2|uniref:CRISPR-associated endonuclease Cas2 n=1 Tax=Thermoanaerobacterium thermosaccharolyticum TaxID=1517 RepID=UPI001786E5CF|nr:CRISPR-associated endonuclease Cas2 [Thermoanaerobacterium thermosaccharolyticum]MBE0069219.1 CRISPR-associated endonuclease Cas2 [Thermoanaerobacterium thermosaccharolyticum]MBE0228109.1 CRISPR-associated endonuclease Cas2 [Thermoanaerobacterium thermosaccharolyticum]
MAYVIVTYDVSEKRVNKVRKKLKEYLAWVQNSVFEGEISDGKLDKCKNELLKIINRNEDSIYFYEIRFKDNCGKNILGIEKDYDSNIL